MRYTPALILLNEGHAAYRGPGICANTTQTRGVGDAVPCNEVMGMNLGNLRR
jgi:hypothetical protein